MTAWRRKSSPEVVKKKMALKAENVFARNVKRIFTLSKKPPRSYLRKSK